MNALRSFEAWPRTPDLRVGWCPGALRPMPAGDGLLVRTKPRGQRLTLAQASAVAALAARYGNGALGLTARGNIQLRGVGEAGLPALTAALDDLGLIDASAEGEAVRNVLSNPLAGADSSALCDLRPAVAALEQRLATDPASWQLPAKFAWSVDQGGGLSLAGVASDVMIEAVDHAGTLTIIIALDGGTTLAVCPPETIVDAAVRLAEAFCALCAAEGLEPHRMRDLVARCGAPAVFRRAGLEGAPATLRRAAPARSAEIGLHRRGAWSAVHVAPAFGLLDANTLAAFAARAEGAGASDLRLTPWRTMLVPGLGEQEAARLAASLVATGLILDPADPRLAVAACVGAPACHRATTPVPADAALLAALLPGTRAGGPWLHVSGCAKGCALAGPAPVTLVGRGGRYNLVRHGKAGDAPVESGLTIDALPPLLSELAT